MSREDGDSSQLTNIDEDRIRRLENVCLTLADSIVSSTSKNKETGDVMFEKFARLQPPAYRGKVNPVELESWEREMEKLFEVVEVSEEKRVRYASHYLKGEADDWWKFAKIKLVTAPGFGWERFIQELRSRFYPPELQRVKQQEFLALEQGSMSVQEFTSKFTELSKFAQKLMTTDEERVQYYEEKLTPEIGKILVGLSKKFITGL